LTTKIPPYISIILLNYNGSEYAIACLQSLKKISYPNFSIIIVDNASPDDSMEKIERYLLAQAVDNYAVFASPVEAMQSRLPQPKYTLLQTGHNGGYGHGNNIGIRYALKEGADYVLILNNDTVVDPSFLEPMVQMCEENKNIGIVSSKIYIYDRPDVFWFNGGKFHPFTSKVEHVNFNEKDSGQKALGVNTFISGCMWLIPKHVFEIVGLINEEYFMYVEDLEYCQRVLNKGYSLRLCEQSKIWHKVGSSTGGKFSQFSVFWRTRNMNRFIIKSPNSFLCKAIALTVFNLKLFLNLIRNRNMSLIKIQFQAIKECMGNP